MTRRSIFPSPPTIAVPVLAWTIVACAGPPAGEPSALGRDDSDWPVATSPLPTNDMIDPNEAAPAAIDVCDPHTLSGGEARHDDGTWTALHAELVESLAQASSQLQSLRSLSPRTADGTEDNPAVDGYTEFLYQWMRTADPMLVLTDRGFRIADERVCRLASVATTDEQRARSLEWLEHARRDSGMAPCLAACSRALRAELDEPGSGVSADVDSEGLLAE